MPPGQGGAVDDCNSKIDLASMFAEPECAAFWAFSMHRQWCKDTARGVRRMIMRIVSAAGMVVPLFLSAVNPSPARADTLFVANNGIDSATCGSRSEPCRSISMAIDLAIDGDRILVGPGVYGDLDADGDFDDEGDERAEGELGCGCMINVSKSITIHSTDGAHSTIIDVGFPVGQRIAVLISADDVTFGARGKGFHVTSREIARAAASGSPRALAGIAVDGQAARTVIEGNMATKTVDGFAVRGHGSKINGNISASNARDGFRVDGHHQSLIQNVAINNTGVGFHLHTGSGNVLDRSSAIGNKTCGIEIGSGVDSVVIRNNIVANGTLNPVLANCGLRTRVPVLTATDNFWGADAGPGPDPADEFFVGDSPDNDNAAIFPVRREPFPVRGF